ncbi:hypothetical protein BDF20DRAFT_818405 [Mycotypha africana]|uniref:uncharacterized protein n=1 Tax=Mycotypha africana TaxID=64632 RepID=UPI0023002C22|nr:uncharacterized protein BDF20DRAFT_818405 [Mycotypha africana]KAI8982086.1 hypothetical protein BDF20DRAFT_818405 [Mycotypha africana]
MHCTTTYSLCVSKRTLSLWTIPKLFLSGQKISLWTIPKYLLTGKLNGSKNKKHRHWLLGAFGVATFLSSLFGPVVWVAVGGTASIVCWRLFRKAQKWWTSSTHSTITDTLLSQIGTHYAVDLVRNEVVQKLQDYFEKTEKGQAMLEQMFPTDNNSHSLSWEDVSRSEVVRLTNNKHMHRVSVCFSVVKDGREGQQHPCQVMASAIISDEGKMDLEEVKLSSPEWNEDEIIPLSSLK